MTTAAKKNILRSCVYRWAASTAFKLSSNVLIVLAKCYKRSSD